MSTVASGSRYLSVQAGQLAALFDKHTAALRNLSVGSVCVWRELIVLVRDHQWQTVPAQLDELQSHIGPNQFEFRFRCRCRSGAVDFEWTGVIQGDAAGSIDYQFFGESRKSFAANRIGFCLLYPCEVCAGRPLRQERTDLGSIEGRFPTLVEPQIVGRYSICNLTGLSHEYADGHWATAQFEGDLFETEDQRNWTDSSFKTYCTPLEMPFPVTLAPGEQRRQRVRLSLESVPVSNSVSPVFVVRVARRRDAAWQPVPQFGMGLWAMGTEFPQSWRSHLAELCRHLRVQILRYDWLLGRNLESACPRVIEAAEIVAAAGCQLELVIQLPRGGDALPADWQRAVEQVKDALCRVVVYRRGEAATWPADLAAVRKGVKRWNVPIGGGSDANFCELIREQALGNFPLGDADFLAWSINPQVHASDDLSLLETPRSLPAIVQTAHRFSGGRPLVVTPITLKPRFNAVASGAPGPDEWPPPPIDERQSAPIAAAWSLATWHSLASSGVAGATWFEAFGPRGLAAIQMGEELPALFPVAKVFAELASLEPISVRAADSSCPSVSAVEIRARSGAYLSLVNLQAGTVDVQVELDGNDVASHRVKLDRYESRHIPLSSP